MPDKKVQVGRDAGAVGEQTAPASYPQRILDFMHRVWRPVASGVVFLLALLLIWHGVSGKNGLTDWRQKRAEDQKLRQEIDDLQQTNQRLREQNNRLKSNPDAVNQVAHDQLHYTKPNEVIVQLPAEKKAQSSSPGK